MLSSSNEAGLKWMDSRDVKRAELTEIAIGHGREGGVVA